MTDVSQSKVDVSEITPLTKNLTPDPYYELTKKAYYKIIDKYGTVVRNDYQLVKKVLYEDTEVIREEYDEVVKMHGYEKLEKFRKTLARMFRCLTAVDQNRNIVSWQKVHWPCNTKSCQIGCLPRRATECLRYPHIIVMMGMCDDHDEAVLHIEDIKSVLKAMEVDYITVVLTPTHDNINLISIGCLRQDELSPLLPDNDVKKTIKFIAENWPGFEKVHRMTSDDGLQTTYITQGNIVVTTDEMYMALSEGQASRRQKGTIPGFELDTELNQIVHLTKDQRKERRDKEENVVKKFNNPSASSDVPTDKKKLAMKKAIKRTSAHRERAAFQSDSNDDLAYNVNNVSAAYIDELEELGFPQPELQTAVRLTQRDIDDFNRLVAIPKIGHIPENILDIEFTDHDLSRETHGLKDLISKMQSQTLASVQEKLRTNISIDELVNMFIKQVEYKPPG